MSRMRPRYASSEDALIVMFAAPLKTSGSSCRAHRHPAHDTEGAATAAFQRPEQVGISACVRDPNLAIGSDYFSFEHTPRSRTVVLGEAPKATALNQTRQAHGKASAALHVFSALRGDRVVCLRSDRPGAERHCRLRLHSVLASIRNERVMHRDIVHVTRRDQQRIGRIGGTLIAMTAALDHQGASLCRAQS